MRLATALAALSLSLPAGAPTASAGEGEPAAAPIRDLHYGDVLFHFFQDDYLESLVRYEAFRDFGHFRAQAADAELLSGGLYLSLGLLDEATAIFERLLAGPVPGSVADRAHYYLARIAYQRGYYPAAQRSLERIRSPLEGELEYERLLLAANVLMAQGRYEEAVGALQTIPEDADWAAYARFNLGVAMVRSGRAEQGRQLLDSVGRLRGRDDEQLALRDRANLALGFAWLQQGTAEPAVQALSRVRLDGPFSQRALLGLGWAELDAKRPERALVPWLELRERPPIDAAVLESLLAVPYAYTQLASNGQAAGEYRGALAAYAEERRRLDESIAAVRAEGFLDALLAEQDEAGAGIGEFWSLRQLEAGPATRYLPELMASHPFQEGVRNYRDLRWMQSRILAWQRNVAAFDEMIATRERAAAERGPRREQALATTDLDALAVRRDALAERARVITLERDVAALATPEQATALARLDLVEASLARMPPGERRDELAARARLLRGTLGWQLDAEYKLRQRRLGASLRELDRELELARDRLARVDAAGPAAALDTAALAIRAARLRERIAQVEPRINAVVAAQERALAELAVGELEARKRRLDSYAGQAQFALASLYDRAAAGGAP
jgi:hypothetical protein